MITVFKLLDCSYKFTRAGIFHSTRFWRCEFRERLKKNLIINSECRVNNLAAIKKFCRSIPEFDRAIILHHFRSRIYVLDIRGRGRAQIRIME